MYDYDELEDKVVIRKNGEIWGYADTPEEAYRMILEDIEEEKK